ncbi:hypothetical protein PRIPAC_96598 [Pristionchus pacificus]|uniref:Uncharacterized protein n=1 Tax=Pristionchus pacificus TaxID=54126 RepID=A0A2A6D2Y3_PRIPA|nr:hypothetical protein PRIPAC_96598 [Pristionchus pacificus]|eukprot:PDM84653.1 hypothetical protein PRIPAC_33676 [Pristionchus pacificus]
MVTYFCTFQIVKVAIHLMEGFRFAIELSMIEPLLVLEREWDFEVVRVFVSHSIFAHPDLSTYEKMVYASRWPLPELTSQLIEILQKCGSCCLQVRAHGQLRELSDELRRKVIEWQWVHLDRYERHGEKMYFVHEECRHCKSHKTEILDRFRLHLSERELVD